MSDNRLTTEFRTGSPKMAEILTDINALTNAADREEALAFLHITLARGCWRRAEWHRESERRRAKRAAKKAER